MMCGGCCWRSFVTHFPIIVANFLKFIHCPLALGIEPNYMNDSIDAVLRFPIHVAPTV